jgi:hypothetical protein
MQKEVIYIDVDDDITAIIGKIKASNEKIVALVPPKRVGVLQSAVNLRLLDRMAKTGKKHLVIITNNQALIALTASARIPVAKNLQSKPEIAEIPALSVDDDDDIIDGADLPVGDHAKAAAIDAKQPANAIARRPSRNDAIETIEAVENDEPAVAAGAAGLAAVSAASKTSAAKAAKPKVKIPNFDSFRKRLVLIGLAGVLLIAGLVWAFVFAPAATIVITASTEPAPVSASVKLGGTAATNPEQGVVSSVSQQLKKDATVQFDATGKADRGEKATGTVVFQNCNETTQTIPAGTTISDDGLSFVTTAAATAGPGSGGFGGCSTPGTSSPVGVTATEAGADYNLEEGTSFSVSGYSYSGIRWMRAEADTDFTGGSTREVTVVTDDDIQRALGQLMGESSDGAKSELKKKFGNGEVVIDSSFVSEQGELKSSPAKDEEVSAGTKATLTVPMTYTMQAFSQSAIKTYLDSRVKEQLDDTNTQQIYDNGLDDVALGNFQRAEDGTMTVTLTTTARIGPKIDETSVKDQVKGKITGDVQSVIGAIDGVQQVEVEYSYFWVRTVPSDSNKIRIEFELNND